MALLKEDNSFTHVIAIDFGTGCSGYNFSYQALQLLPDYLIKRERLESRFSILVMEVTIKRHQQPYCLTMISNF